MPYLPTSQAFLEQSALLLEAYPETTRVTTKYGFPSQRPSAQKKPSSTPNPETTDSPAPTAANPVAVLTLKTYNPTAGICLKYRTNKAAEVGRLVTSLGKLASGANAAGLGLSAPPPTTTASVSAAADVEMTDAPAVVEEAASANASKTDTGAKGGKSKKKGGKGKR